MRNHSRRQAMLAAATLGLAACGTQLALAPAPTPRRPVPIITELAGVLVLGQSAPPYQTYLFPGLSPWRLAFPRDPSGQPGRFLPEGFRGNGGAITDYVYFDQVWRREGRLEFVTDATGLR